jgi:cell fate (sporulation/competence/biofilm development) regulator YmcA (YheA/YmcA/DUF963 family)
MILYFSGDISHPPEAILGEASVMLTFFDYAERRIDAETGVQKVSKRLKRHHAVRVKKLNKKKPR